MADSDEPKEKPTEFAKFAAGVEKLLKLATALVAIIYLFGIVVLNVHLGRFGYHSLGLLQLEYIAAGVWSFAPIVMMCLLVFIGFYFGYFPALIEKAGDEVEQTANEKTPERENEAATSESNNQKANNSAGKIDKIPVFLAIFLIWVGVVSLCFWAMSIEFTLTWLGLGIGGLFILTGIGVASVIIAEKSVGSNGHLIAGTILTLLIIALPFYLVLFGRYIYPTIPDVWGGGKAAQVILIAKDDDSKAVIEATGLKFTDSKRSETIGLIWETDKESVVLPAAEGEKAIKISNDMISGVIYK